MEHACSGSNVVQRRTSRGSRSIVARLGSATLRALGPHSSITGCDGSADVEGSYDTTLSRIQRFRGRVYLEDRAIPAHSLDDEGRHRAVDDESSWHMLITLAGDEIIGCIRLRLHEGNRVEGGLGVNDCVARMHHDRALIHRAAIREFIAKAESSGRPLCEPGGWAIRPDFQKSSAALILGCACWSMGQILGGLVGLSFANTFSAAIIRRLGGFSLVPDDAHGMHVFDKYHGRDLELIAFDSSRPAIAYDSFVREIRDHFEELGVARPRFRRPGVGSE